MLNIEIKKTIETRKTPEGNETNTRNYVVINGIEDLNSSYHEFETVKGTRAKLLTATNSEIVKILTKLSFEQLTQYFSAVAYSIDFKQFPYGKVDIRINCLQMRIEPRVPFIELSLSLEFEDWARPWSINQFADEFENQLKQVNNPIAVYWQDSEEWLTSGFGMRYFPNAHTPIEEAVDVCYNLLLQCHDEANKVLTTKHDGLVTLFSFPKETETACKQYLVYFGQFLADIGIEADTEIKVEANNTLFKVIPKNKEESLQKIKDALAVYLDAPSNPSFETAVQQNTDIAFHQLNANILHLKGQLALAGAMIEAKNETIKYLQLSNFQLEQRTIGPLPQTDAKEEPVIKDIVSIKKYDGKWFSVNLPEILRRLKRRF